MRTNTRFPVAVHIMTALAITDVDQCTAENLARSVNTNPVVIRRMAAKLKQAGLIEVRRGKGGAFLVRTPDQISLLDIYNAVKDDEDAALFAIHPHPCPTCPIGANIHEVMDKPLLETQKKLEENLGTYTLADIAQSICKKTGYHHLNTETLSEYREYRKKCINREYIPT